MPQTTKPSQGHTVWTPSALPSQVVDPGPSKKNTGWVPDEQPPCEEHNWLFWTYDLWDQYFEYITDTHTTQIATLTSTVATLGTAAAISASNAGHSVLTGTTVQAQLDEADTNLKNIFDALTGGEGIDLVGYVPTVPADWSLAPTHAGPALDQLAARMKVVENATAGANYDDQTFFDYCIPADSPNGAGNTGLNDTNNTNPRGIKLADGKLLYGEERVYIRDIQPTGNYDANGLQEWCATSPADDIRIRLYGQWTGYSSNSDGYFVFSSQPGDYILITGVFDSLAIMGVPTTSAGNEHEVWVDGVDTGTTFSQRPTSGGNVVFQPVLQHSFFNSQMLGLTQDLHTIKIVNQSTDSNCQLYFNGVIFINTNPVEMAVNMYLQKVQTAYGKQSPTLGSVTSNGGSVARYVDRTDSLRKDIASNCYVFSSSVTGSLSSGATNFTLASAAGLASNELLLISDGPGNSEVVLANSVNTISG